MLLEPEIVAMMIWRGGGEQHKKKNPTEKNPTLALVLVLGNYSEKAELGSHSETSAGAVEAGAECHALKSGGAGVTESYPPSPPPRHQRTKCSNLDYLPYFSHLESKL